MAGTVLYRTWRPRRFAEIVGQEPIVRTLKNAVAQEKVAHAYLFCGPRGTGKTSTGRILAKAINTAHDDEGESLPDDEEARAFDEGRALDLVEIDAASNRGIDNIRELRERANYVPTSSRYKVYLIDEVHQLTDAAVDALLKTLEEPPPHVVFILATTEPEALKPTIISRCQRFDFRRVSVADIAARLRQIADAEGITIPDAALDLIAREATGSVRDAINLLDQVWATYGDTVSLEETVAALGLSVDARALQLAQAALRKDLREGLVLLAAVREEAGDLARFQRQVVQHLRHALLVQTGAEAGLALSEPEREALQRLVEGVETGTIVAALKAFATADLRSDPYASLPLELALAQIVYQPSEPVVEPAPAATLGGRAAKPERSPPRQRGRKRGPRQAPAPGGPRPAAAPAPPESDRPPPRDTRPPPPPRERTPEEQLLEDIREALRRGKEIHLRAALTSSCRIVESQKEEVVIGFFPRFEAIHKSKVEEGSAVVAAAASDVLGRPVTIRCTVLEDPAPQGSALVAEAERLGARVIDRRGD